mmetsp:Transcript_42963/g.65002  ORF Transcript_42963/g.65002 Transcript_42963/m.65002 type:complete len:108 (+) Transcript_42963:25-348(+)
METTELAGTKLFIQMEATTAGGACWIITRSLHTAGAKIGKRLNSVPVYLPYFLGRGEVWDPLGQLKTKASVTIKSGELLEMIRRPEPAFLQLKEVVLRNSASWCIVV